MPCLVDRGIVDLIQGQQRPGNFVVGALPAFPPQTQFTFVSPGICCLHTARTWIKRRWRLAKSYSGWRSWPLIGLSDDWQLYLLPMSQATAG
jgi:hypothetical protein